MEEVTIFTNFTNHPNLPRVVNEVGIYSLPGWALNTNSIRISLAFVSSNSRSQLPCLDKFLPYEGPNWSTVIFLLTLSCWRESLIQFNYFRPAVEWLNTCLCKNVREKSREKCWKNALIEPTNVVTRQGMLTTHPSDLRSKTLDSMTGKLQPCPLKFCVRSHITTIYCSREKLDHSIFRGN